LSKKGKAVKKNPTLAELYALVAEKVISDSLQVKTGESVSIESWTNGLPFARHLVKEARKVGALPILLTEDEETYVYGLKNSPRDSLGKMGKHEYGLLAASDVYVFIPGPAIGAYYPTLTNEESALGTQYNMSWYETAAKSKLRGARLTFGYIGKDLARLLKKSPDSIIKNQLKACLVDTNLLVTRGRELANVMQDGNQARLLASGNALNFVLQGETQVEDGILDEQDVASENNMGYLPGGMIQKQVDPKSVEGSVVVKEAITKLGLITEANLTFKEGRLTSWQGKRSEQKLLDQLLSNKENSMKIVTVGFNPVLEFGNGQNRFVQGCISIGGFGFTGFVKKGTLTVSEKTIVKDGTLS
jgi:leucyl aminopeptidase (aminopeptidase T)